MSRPPRQSETPQAETPRVEPEIIPPDRTGYGRMRWDSMGQRGSHRIYVSRLGPFSIFAFLVALGVVVAVVLALFVGAVLLALPVIVLVIAIALVASLLRPRLRHPRW
jgi:TM2 domain-containing membrane protein YozV